jgi:aminopeptidase
MSEERLRNHARVLVRYSINAKKGDVVAINCTTESEALTVAIYEELLKVGAYPAIRMTPARIMESFFRYAKPHHLETVSAYEKAYPRHCDARINIGPAIDPHGCDWVDPKKRRLYGKTMAPMKQAMLRKRRVSTAIPTQTGAIRAGMGLSAYEDFVYGTVFADHEDPIASWKALRKNQAKLIRKISQAETVRIVGDETDLAFSIKGRPFQNADGTQNMPSGEIYTAPLENSAEGTIKYDYPVGKSKGVTLTFSGGRVVEARAEEENEALQALIDTDSGSRRIGEFGIGTNSGINRFTNNMLFDEKIGGTIHIALGLPIPGTGGTNRSAIHYDMLKDLRLGGAIYLDGEQFQKDGVFI